MCDDEHDPGVTLADALDKIASPDVNTRVLNHLLYTAAECNLLPEIDSIPLSDVMTVWKLVLLAGTLDETTVQPYRM